MCAVNVYNIHNKKLTIIIYIFQKFKVSPNYEGLPAVEYLTTQ